MKSNQRYIVNDNVNCSYYNDNTVDLFKNSDFLTIVGCAECVKDDIEKFGVHGDIMAINHMAIYLELPCLHLVSLHVELIANIRFLRKLHLNNQKFHNFQTHKVGLLNKSVDHFEDSIDFLWKFENQPLNSGISGILIGLALGYKKILLLGMPFSTQRRFHDIVTGERKFNSYKDSLEKTVGHEIIKESNVVRSASGLTREIYGKPDKLWLQERK